MIDCLINGLIDWLFDYVCSSIIIWNSPHTRPAAGISLNRIAAPEIGWLIEWLIDWLID